MNLKTIHRIFFGFGGEEDLYLPYMELWKKALPHYEIKLWNASNLPLDLNPWTRKMTELGDGVFLSDFFRWWVCKEYGGIYLDADIEIYDGAGFDALITELEDSQDYDALIGVETPLSGYTSHSFASKPNSSLASYMCGLYENLDVFSVARKKMLIGPHLSNLYFWEKQIGKQGFISPKEPEIFARVKVYPLDFFSPIQYGFKPSLEYFSSRTCLAHHYGDSWIDDESALSIQRDAMRSNLLKRRPKLVQDYIQEDRGFFGKISRISKHTFRWLIHKILIPKDSRRRDYCRQLLFSLIKA